MLGNRSPESFLHNRKDTDSNFCFLLAKPQSLHELHALRTPALTGQDTTLTPCSPLWTDYTITQLEALSAKGAADIITS